MIHEVDSLEDLRLERERLEREMTIARTYLDAKLEQTYAKGKKLVIAKTSWPLAISSLAAFGAQQLGASAVLNSPHQPMTVMSGIQQGIAAVQQPGKEKWYALIPLALQFWNQWTAETANKHDPEQYRSNEYRPADTMVKPPPVPTND